MTNHTNPWCSRCEEFHDESLSPAEKRDFEEHLGSCDSCRGELETLDRLSIDLRNALSRRLEDDADLRIRLGLKDERHGVSDQEEILTIEDVAGMLRLPLPEVVALLDRLPAFELGGRIRFRRDRILAWLKEQEDRFSRESDVPADRTHRKIIAFPGH